MIPMRPDAAQAQFFADGRYLLEAHHERSHARHKAYFAALAQAWHSLPEALVELHPSPEHLRKHALIACGWRDDRYIDCGNAEQARKTAAFVRPLDSFAVVTTEGRIVRVWTAQSQSYKAMGRTDFNQSMDDVLSWVAALVGVPRPTLEEQGEVA